MSRSFAKWILNRKWVRPWLKRVIRSLLKPSVIRYQDCDFLVHKRDNLTEFYLWKTGRANEHDAVQYVSDLLDQTGATIVDVGANAGVLFLPILNAAGAGAVGVAFEPNPTLIDRLRKNISLNGFANAKVFDCAIGEKDSISKLFFPKRTNLGEGRIDLGYANGATDNISEVQVRVLAECLTEAGVTKLDFLKVDVEGREDRVIFPLLSGSENLWPVRILFEIKHQKHWKYPLFEKLLECGYTLEKDYQDNCLYCRKTS